MKTLPIAFLLAALAASACFAAMESPEVASAESEDIVVVARRSGAPMWTIRTGAGTVILVGEIAAVPKATPWRPERLEGAT